MPTSRRRKGAITTFLMSSDFEQMSIIPTLVITPMAFLGGSLYSLDMLPSFWPDFGQVLGFDSATYTGPAESDGRMLLALDALVTAVHLAFPIRLLCSVAIDVVASLICLVPACTIGSPEGPSGVSLNSSWYMFLIFLSSVGKRRLECSGRRAFVQFSQENNLRTQSAPRVLEQLSSPLT